MSDTLAATEDRIRTHLGRIRACHRALTRFGNPYVRLSLEIGNEIRLAYVWRRLSGPRRLPVGLEVVVDARTRHWNGRAVLDVSGIEPARLSPRAELPGGVAVLPDWLLEGSSCPRHVSRLWAQIHLLQSSCLKEFTFRVFHDPDIGAPFVTLAASHSHHHRDAGGLLQHALECMTRLPWMEGMSLDEWEIARIAALFHDVGKILGTDETGRATTEARLTRHEDATLEVLSPHIAWLRAQDPRLLAALKHHLTWSHRQGRPWMPGALLVRSMDQISAALDGRRRAFEGAPVWWEYARLDGPGPVNRYWRIPGNP